jgi:hypothetical protein
MAKPTIFKPDQFTATEHYTAEKKAEFANRFAAFLMNGCKPGEFSPILYSTLRNTFGHIAHTNLQGFYHAWFATPDRRVAFIQHTLDWPCHGDPKFTFCDVEWEFQRWLRGVNLLGEYQRAVQSNQHYESVEDVARALLKVVKAPTAEIVAARVKLAVEQVQADAGVTLDDEARIAATAEKLTREFCIKSITFKLAAISEGTKSFGHHGHIFVAESGEAWQCSKWRGHDALAVGTAVDVPLVGGVPDWSALGYEVPEQRSKPAPADVLAELWPK